MKSSRLVCANFRLKTKIAKYNIPYVRHLAAVFYYYLISKTKEIRVKTYKWIALYSI